MPKSPLEVSVLQVDGALQTSTILHVKGESRLTFSDEICIDGVCSVNPQTQESTSFPLRFLVNRPAKDGVMEIAPGIVTEGQYRNAIASPADGAMILPWLDPEWHE